MATLVIRRLDEDVKERISRRAAAKGRSMEEEVRQILQAAVPADAENWGLRLVETTQELFGARHGVDLELPPRGPAREPPTFEE